MAVTNYYPSTAVTVFPSVYRSFNPSGKFTNETNFANIVKSIVNKDSYIVGYDGNTLRLVIFGYYFAVQVGSGFNNKTSSSPTWASIRLENDLEDRCYNLVSYEGGTPSTLDTDPGGSGTTLFTGLKFGTGSAPTGTLIKSLDIWNGDSLNTARISSDSVYYSNNSDLTLTNVLGTKQEKFDLDSNGGLEWKTNSSGKHLKITDSQLAKLNGLNASGVNHSITNPQLITFDSTGILKNNTSNVGHGYDTNNTTQSIYLSNGVLMGGVSINYSQVAPTASNPGTEGDIWIKYS